jgi:hypothetical protein
VCRLGRHHRFSPGGADRAAPSLGGVATVGDDPADRPKSQGFLKQSCGRAEFGCLAWDQGEGERAAFGIADRAGLGAEASTGAPERLGARPPFWPAAFWCARTEVPSRKTSPRPGCPASRRCSKARAQIPARDQRMCNCAAFHHGPNSAGTARHLAPLRCRQTTASTVRRSSGKGRPVPDLTASRAAFSRPHSMSLRTGIHPERPTPPRVV